MRQQRFDRFDNDDKGGRAGRRQGWRHHPGGPWGGGPGGPWAEWGREFGGRGGRRGGPRVRRGDVRHAILDVLARAAEGGEPINGYQVIQQIAERSDNAWRPSPGSVYPTIQQLEDEGLVESDEEHGRRAIRLTERGRRYVADHADELAAVWQPFDRPAEGGRGDDPLKAEIAQALPAIWQVATSGTPAQRQAAAGVLAQTRKRLYGILAGSDADEDGDGGGASEG
ncbi:PadR family transcriptional regulator [Nocardioides sp. DS6]|uniref:PadR family transcriptional regulator n=1 Tax=Nocardioides eburneus TaxID=3231482 RepID=A0ABV3SXZ0_9ACTN